MAEISNGCILDMQAGSIRTTDKPVLEVVHEEEGMEGRRLVKLSDG